MSLIKYVVLFVTVKACCFAIYPAAAHKWKIIDHKKRHVQAVYNELAVFDREKASRAKRGFLKDLSEGTCYGEAILFMMENPPTQYQIQFLDNDTRQQNAIWVQTQQNDDCDLYEEAKRLKRGLRKKHRKLQSKDLRSYGRICQHLGKSPKAPLFKQDIRFQKMLLEKVENLYRHKNVVKLGDGNIDHGHKSRKTFAAKVINGYKTMQEKKKFTDIVYGFDFKDKYGRMDHAILVQHTHLRIYDAERGIYQYSSLKSLLRDLGRRIRNLRKNTYVDYELFAQPTTMDE